MQVFFLVLNYPPNCHANSGITQGLPYCTITHFLLLATCDLNQKIKTDSKSLQQHFSSETGNRRHCVTWEACVIRRISPLNLSVNFLLLSPFICFFYCYGQIKRRVLGLYEEFKSKRKKVRELNLKDCNQAIKTAVENNLTTWKSGPIPHLSGPQLAIRKLKVSFVTHFYKFPQINGLNLHHVFSLLFFPCEFFNLHMFSK